MIKFKVGDKVRFIGEAHMLHCDEEYERSRKYTYTICDHDMDEEYPEVVLDVAHGWSTDSTGTGCGWWVSERNLELAILETRIGGEIIDD